MGILENHGFLWRISFLNKENKTATLMRERKRSPGCNRSGGHSDLNFVWKRETGVFIKDISLKDICQDQIKKTTQQ